MYCWEQSDVDEFMGRSENESNATLVLKRLDESHTKYRFMEQNLTLKKKRLKKQIPDIQTSIDVLKLVKLKRVCICSDYLKLCSLIDRLVSLLSNPLILNFNIEFI